MPKCSAHSVRTGKPGRRNAICGGNVCPAHGGRALQVKEAARRRLLDMIDPALKKLWDLIEQDENLAVSLGAIKAILGRAGIDRKASLELPDRVTITFDNPAANRIPPATEEGDQL